MKLDLDKQLALFICDKYAPDVAEIIKFHSDAIEDFRKRHGFKAAVGFAAALTLHLLARNKRIAFLEIKNDNRPPTSS